MLAVTDRLWTGFLSLISTGGRNLQIPTLLRLGKWADRILGAGPGSLKYDMGLLPFLQGKGSFSRFSK